MNGAQEYRINEYITLKLEEGKTNIYVAREKFIQCKYLLLVDPEKTFDDEIDSIDDAAEKYDAFLEGAEITPKILNISPEEEFKAHCSNLHAWNDYGYDPRILHSNLSFPLLKALTEAGDRRAQQVFKEEIAKRVIAEDVDRIDFLYEEDYVKFLTREEFWSLYPQGASQLERIEQLLQTEIKYCGDAAQSFPDLLGTKNNIGFSTHGGVINDVSFSMTQMPEGVEWCLIFDELSKISTLIQLDIYDNEISEIPEAIGRFSKLRGLNLSHNQLKSISESLGELKALRGLNLSHNQLKSIPESLGELKALMELNLSHNQLKFLPKTIGNLTSLEILSLGNNPLTPETLEPLLEAPNLRKIFIGKNFRPLEDWKKKLESKSILLIY